MATLYFNNAVDTFVATLGNWWQDDAYTIPADSLPVASDDVVFNNCNVYGVTGFSGETATYRSVTADSSNIAGDLHYNPWILIATNGITISNCSIQNEIHASGIFTNCILASSSDWASAGIVGNVSLYNCTAYDKHNADFPTIVPFTGNVDAYYPTGIITTAVSGTLTRHGYTLQNTCVAHCNLDETSGTRQVLDLYEDPHFINSVGVTGTGNNDADGTYTRATAVDNFENGGGGVISADGPDGYYTLYFGGDALCHTIDNFQTWISYVPPNDPTTTSIAYYHVGYGTGLIGNAAKFDGNSLVNETEVQFIAESSFSVWVNFPTIPTSQAQAIIGTGYFGYPTSATLYSQNGGVSLYVESGSSNTLIGPSVNANTWYHYVVTISGSTATMYRNGDLLGSMAIPYFITAGINLSKFIGGYPLTGNVLVDEFNIFSVDLTQSQVSALYNNGIGLTYPFATGGTKKIDIYKLLGIPFPPKDFKYQRLTNLPFFVKI
jgi:Concanavalin A-like lectin/glucanases superfamily